MWSAPVRSAETVAEDSGFLVGFAALDVGLMDFPSLAAACARAVKNRDSPYGRPPAVVGVAEDTVATAPGELQPLPAAEAQPQQTFVPPEVALEQQSPEIDVFAVLAPNSLEAWQHLHQNRRRGIE